MTVINMNEWPVGRTLFRCEQVGHRLFKYAHGVVRQVGSLRHVVFMNDSGDVFGVMSDQRWWDTPQLAGEYERWRQQTLADELQWNQRHAEHVFSACVPHIQAQLNEDK